MLSRSTASLTAQVSSVALQAAALSLRVKPLSRDWAAIGDSRVAQGLASYKSSTCDWSAMPTEANVSIAKRNTGFQHWVDVYGQGKFRFPGSLNFGLSGDTLANIVTSGRLGVAITKAVAAGAAGIFVLASTNDLGTGAAAGATLAQLQSYAQSAVAQAQAASLMIALCTDLPRGFTDLTTYTLSAANLVIQGSYRRWLMETYRNVPGVFIVDAYPFLVDPTQSTGNWADATLSVTTDRLHLTSKSAQQRLARCLVDQLGPLYSPARFVPAHSADSYPGNPNGFINLNPFFAGTGGNIQSSAGGTGTLGNNWSAFFNLANRGGLSVAYTAGYAKTDPLTGASRTAQRLVYSGTPTAANLNDGVGQTLSTTTYPAGTKIRVVAELDVLAGATGIQSIQVGLEGNRSNAGPNPSNLNFFNAYAGQDNGYPVDLSLGVQNGLWMSEDIVLPSDVTADNIRLKLTFQQVAVSATIDVYWMAAFIVP